MFQISEFRPDGKCFELVILRAALEDVGALANSYPKLIQATTLDLIRLHKVDLNSHGIELSNLLDVPILQNRIKNSMLSSLEKTNCIRSSFR